MLEDMIKILFYLLVIVAVLGLIGYLFFGWAGVIGLAVLIGLPMAISMINSHRKKVEAREAQRAKERALWEAQEQARKEKLARQAQIQAEVIEYQRQEEQRKKEQEAEAEQRKKEQEAEAEQRKKEQEAEAEQRLKAIAERIAKKDQEFLSELESIPAVEFELSTEKYKRRALRDMPEVKFTNITKRTNPLTLTSYVVVDVETTGIPRTSKIIELSAIVFEAGEPVEKFSTLVNPGCNIPPEATAINGITDDMVKDAPQIWEVMPAFQRFVGKLPMVGHNLAFDLEFLYPYGFNLDNPKQRFYDTLQLAKATLVKAKFRYTDEFEMEGEYNDYDVDDYKLGTLCEYYGIRLASAHRACSDCLATGRLFAELAKARMQ